MPKTITAQQAVDRGALTVTGPVMLMMFAPPLIIGGLVALVGFKDLGIGVGAALIVPSWIGAWLTWSILTPRWRVWAYERVDDLDELKARAIAAQLIWPDGHLFQKTEIRPTALRQRLGELEKRHQAQ